MDNESEINKLFKRLDNLLQRQDELSNDIVNLRKELRDIKDSKENKARTSEEKFSFTTVKPLKSQNSSLHVSQSNKSNIEKFIGENLISKIGVVITIIGVFIGIKYTIEKDLISPLSRILLGYLFGLVFLLFGVKLKKRFKNFSAVLVSGGISITYFVTFSAYNYYNLIPQSITFILLFICTVFAVFSAIKFNTQIIALIGLVGAYAVPFLLSNNSGNVSFLFSYISIINIGILFISFKKYWKSLFYCSFLITWLILIFWFVSEYQESLYFSLTLTFSLIFFLVFYATSLSFKLIKNERFGFESIVLLLANSLIFYSIGFAVLSDHEIGKQLLGAFTLGNSILHIGIGAVIYKINGVDKNFFLLVTGIALIFITIAIPVELNGNWVTLLWAGEGTLLFWIGRTKKHGHMKNFRIY